MIRIGDFSKFSRVSIKTLRYYDEMGLLKPVHVDRATGYRYYEYDQLALLYRILAFRELGFSLEEIGRLLEEDLSTEQMRGMLKLRQAELRQRVEEDRVRLAQVERWLNQLEQEDSVSKYDVVMKRLEPMRVAAVRGVVPTPPDQRTLWDDLLRYIDVNKVRMMGPPMALYHDPDFRERDWDIEVCMPVAEDSPAAQKPVNVYTLPAVETMACVVHAGPFATLGQAYDALAKWIDENGYRIVGPARELNLRLPDKLGDQNDPNTVNEIQLPVEKV
jgi:DNA-binding transcriptional MerR regulator